MGQPLTARTRPTASSSSAPRRLALRPPNRFSQTPPCKPEPRRGRRLRQPGLNPPPSCPSRSATANRRTTPIAAKVPQTARSSSRSNRSGVHPRPARRASNRCASAARSSPHRHTCPPPTTAPSGRNTASGPEQLAALPAAQGGTYPDGAQRTQDGLSSTRFPSVRPSARARPDQSMAGLRQPDQAHGSRPGRAAGLVSQEAGSRGPAMVVPVLAGGKRRPPARAHPAPV